jgi:hypothetical protein
MYPSNLAIIGMELMGVFDKGSGVVNVTLTNS